MQNIYTRIAALNDQLDYFLKRAPAMLETHLLIETLRFGNYDPAHMAAALRAEALKAQHFSPVIWAYMEQLADTIDPKQKGTTHVNTTPHRRERPRNSMPRPEGRRLSRPHRRKRSQPEPGGLFQ